MSSTPPPQEQSSRVNGKVNGAEHAASTARAVPDTSPWDGHTWEPRDPNQVGSGWTEDDIIGPPPYNPDGPPEWGLPTAEELQDAADLALEYERVVAEILRRHAAANGTTDATTDGAETDDDEDDDKLSADDDFDEEMLHAPTYMEYVLTLRDCERPECSRRRPCSTCRQHDGAYLPSHLWHFLSDARIEAHLTQYLRVRNRLPPWQSSRPAHIPAPVLVFGGEDDPADVPAALPADAAPNAAPAAAPSAGADAAVSGVPVAVSDAPTAGSDADAAAVTGPADAAVTATSAPADVGVPAGSVAEAAASGSQGAGAGTPAIALAIADAAALEARRWQVSLLGFLLFSDNMESAAASYFGGNRTALEAFMASTRVNPTSLLATPATPADDDDDLPDLIAVSDSSPEPSEHGDSVEDDDSSSAPSELGAVSGNP
ncbi:hypothetical protein AURDEDRAFT_124989 [Auricularia subglabra TFB-10046 SS5]|nr:hypothetical protein AURDEDRAFT_124989 [Auricularia subglabra TFB-10046 SS5]